MVQFVFPKIIGRTTPSKQSTLLCREGVIFINLASLHSSIMIFARQRGMTIQWTIAKLNLNEVIQDFAELEKAFEWECMTCGMSRMTDDMKIKLCSSPSRSHIRSGDQPPVPHIAHIFSIQRDPVIFVPCFQPSMLWCYYCMTSYVIQAFASHSHSHESHTSPAHTRHLWLCGQRRRAAAHNNYYRSHLVVLSYARIRWYVRCSVPLTRNIRR